MLVFIIIFVVYVEFCLVFVDCLVIICDLNVEFYCIDGFCICIIVGSGDGKCIFMFGIFLLV